MKIKIGDKVKVAWASAYTGTVISYNGYNRYRVDLGSLKIILTEDEMILLKKKNHPQTNLFK